MPTPRDLGFLPHDRDSARPLDLEPQPPAPAPAAAAARSWPGEDPNAGNFHYIGAALTPAEFREYCLDYDFGTVPPSYWIWHHTWNPDASWSPVSTNQATWWDRNEQGMSLEQKKAKRKPQLDSIMRYYRDSRKWTVGPHLFVDDVFIWLFTPMWYVGIHANEGNSYHTSGGTLRYSVGCEVIGAYDAVAWPPQVRAMAGWACACVKARLKFENVYTPAGQDRPDLHDLQLSGHRDYTTDKSCPGVAITEAFYVQAAKDGWVAYQAGTAPGGDPLRAKTIPGPPPGHQPYYCSTAAFNFYMAYKILGFPLRDEYHAIDPNGVACSILKCERGAIKTSTQYGTELILIEPEALPMKVYQPPVKTAQADEET